MNIIAAAAVAAIAGLMLAVVLFYGRAKYWKGRFDESKEMEKFVERLTDRIRLRKEDVKA